MEEATPKYINPYTDFGFKKLFGEEGNKDLLVDFLNQLLPERHQIAELAFGNSEALADLPQERKAFFDIHCKSATGERFIVEMQKAEVQYFKDRSLFYTTFPIREQAKQGPWDFHLEPVYFIAILDFLYDEREEQAKFRRDVSLKDQDCELFSDKLHFKFLQMPAFNKQPHELVSHFDKWCYFLKNLASLEDIPQILREPVFEKAFLTTELARMSPAQREAYEQSRLNYLGVRAVEDTARRKEKLGLIHAFWKAGATLDMIVEATKLPKEEVQAILNHEALN